MITIFNSPKNNFLYSIEQFELRNSYGFFHMILF